MSQHIKNDINTRHRFLDEAGDTSFYGRYGMPIIGTKEGASLSFLLGMVKVKSDLNIIRDQIHYLEEQVINDPYYKNVPSVQKKASHPEGYYFHATDDPPEIRKLFFDYIKNIDMCFEAVVGRKIPSLFIKKHNKNGTEFYADLLSHLIKNKLHAGGDLILNIAERGNTTKNSNLQLALNKATDRYLKKSNSGSVNTKINFNVQTPRKEPILCVADYLCWAVQRVFERGEPRYYEYVLDKISLVVDIYDSSKYHENKNFYTEKNRLTPLNKLSPPSY